MSSTINRFGKSRVTKVTQNTTYIESQCQYEAERREKLAVSRDIKWAAKVAWGRNKHTYRMKHGDTWIGPPVEMTGIEAGKKNRALQGKYIHALDHGKPARLARWYLWEAQ